MPLSFLPFFCSLNSVAGCVDDYRIDPASTHSLWSRYLKLLNYHKYVCGSNFGSDLHLQHLWSGGIGSSNLFHPSLLWHYHHLLCHMLGDWLVRLQALLWKLSTSLSGNPPRALAIGRLSFPFRQPSQSCSGYHSSHQSRNLSLTWYWQPLSNHRMSPVGSRCKFPDHMQLRLSSVPSY